MDHAVGSVTSSFLVLGRASPVQRASLTPQQRPQEKVAPMSGSPPCFRPWGIWSKNLMKNVVTSNTTAATPTHDGSPPPPVMVWSGRVLSGLFALFLLGASASPKLLHLPVAEATMKELGWPEGYAFS